MIFTQLPLANEAANGWISFSESSAGSPLVGSLSASNYDSAEYALSIENKSCETVTSYSVSKPTTTDINTDGGYKVCVKLSNSVESIYGASDIIKRYYEPSECSDFELVKRTFP